MLAPRVRFASRLAAAVARTAPACVGIDPWLDRLPRPARERMRDRRSTAREVGAWACSVVDAVAGVVPVVKPQSAFFEQLGSPGVAALEQVVAHARARGLLVLLDAKRGDIGSTAEAYARATLDDDGPLGADALTVNPFLGPESLRPFLDRMEHGKGIFVLVRTSNPRSETWQGPVVEDLARRVADWGAGAVVGATLPREASRLREWLGSSWILIPGYGAQGGSLDDLRPLWGPALVNSARGVTFPTEAESAEYDDDPVSVIRRHARALAADTLELQR